jgi:hypothetical protein
LSLRGAEQGLAKQGGPGPPHEDNFLFLKGHNSVNLARRLSYAGLGFAMVALTLVAVTPGVADAVAPGTGTQLVFTTQPGGASGGTAFTTQPVVSIENAQGQVVTTDQTTVTLAITANTGASGAALTTCVGTTTNGVATFAGCTINRSGSNYTLSATDTSDGTIVGVSAAFNVAVGPAAKLAFTSAPTSASGGTAFSPQPVVDVEDAGGNIVTAGSSSVTVTIGSVTAGGTLSGNTAVTTTGGVATFSGLSINTAGSYTLSAADGQLTGATSGSFAVAVGSATRVVFATQPGGASGGTAFGTQPVVDVVDAGGNIVSTDGSSVTVAIGSTTAGGTLAGTATVTATDGAAAFAGLSINKAGSYTLSAADGQLTGATSSSFTVAVGPAAQLAFASAPTSATAGTAFSPQPVVDVEDAGGNIVTTGSSTVSLGLGARSPSGGLLAGCSTAMAAAGVATFANCSIAQAGSGYSLTATDGGLSVTTPTFAVGVGTATALMLVTQPSGASGGSVFTTQPVFDVVDAQGNVVTGDTSSVTVAIGSTTAGGVLSGTATVAVINGVATFTDLSIDKAGSYDLTATDGSLTSATTEAFTVAVGPAAKVVFATSPSGASGGTVFATQPVVDVEDAGGNVVTTDTSSVTVAIGSTTAGGVLSGTATVTAVDGVATFSGLSIDKAGSYDLTATDGGLTSATTAAFTVAVGPAAQLAFTPQPEGASAGQVMTVKVSVEDAGGNVVTGDTSTVTLAIAADGPGGILTGCSTATASSGLATFTGCRINKSGEGYTLQATDSGTSVSPVISQPFSITAGVASQLVFTTEPAGASGGTAFTTQPKVTIEDDQGNVVTDDDSSVALAIRTNPAAGTLSSCPAVDAVNGVATFVGCTIDKAGSGYTLAATDPADGTFSGVSTSFPVTTGPPTQLLFSTQPSATTTARASFAAQPVVTVEDAGGNVVTTDDNPVTLTTSPSTGTLSGTTTVNAAGGVATFTGLSISTAGTYTLGASDPTDGTNGLTASSSELTISPAAASQLVVTTPPAGATGGTAFTTQPTVTVEDVYGNTVTSDGSTVTLAVDPSSTGTGTLTGCTTATATAGVATFTGCSIDTAGSYTLDLSDSSTTVAPTTTTVPVTVGAPSQLVFTTEPGSATGGQALTPEPVVTIEDAGENTVTGDSSVVSLDVSPGSGAAGASVSCKTAAAVAGVATFAGCVIDQASTIPYRLTASTSALIATSHSFTVSVGAPEQLAFTTEPAASTAAGARFSPQPVVTIEDAGGNTVTTDESPVTLSDGSVSAPLGGTSTVDATDGVATFTDLSITTVGTYTLGASDTTDGLTADSDPATIVPAAASQLVFTTPPAGATGGTAFTTQPTVTVEDAYGNTVTGDSSVVTLSKDSSSTGTGTLTGCSTKTATAGVATFAGCSINTIGDYTLRAAASTAGVSPITTTLTVTLGPVAQLVFTTPPAGAVGGIAFTTQPVVAIEDAGANIVTTDNTSAITLGVATGPNGGTLSTCAPATTTAGMATFSGCTLDTAGSYIISATDTPDQVIAAPAAPLTVAVGTPAQLVFNPEPAGATAGSAFTTQPTVTIEDKVGNVETTDTSAVSLAVTPGTGAGSLTGCATRNAVAGVATFTNCEIGKAGTGYTLTASDTADGTFTGVSSVFTVAPSAAVHLTFTTEPGSGTAGVALATQPVVTITDAQGNVETGDTTTVSLAVTGAPGIGTGCATATAVAGVATFSGCDITKAGSYTLTAGDVTDTGTSPVISTSLTIAPAAASQLVFIEVPTNGTAGMALSPQPQVSVEDAYGNVVPTGTDTVSLAITTGTGTSGATLGCSSAVTTAGVASFAGCVINDAGTGYTLTATDGPLSGVSTPAFAVYTSTPTHLVFSTEPGGGATGGTAFTTQPVVTVEDAQGNTVASSSPITLSIDGSSSGTGTLSPACTATTTNGVATFSGCSITTAGSYTLDATDPGDGGGIVGTSNPFTVAVGPASQLVFTTEPPATGSTGGKVFATQPVVAVEDAGGNVVTSYQGPVALTLGTTTGSGTLSPACLGSTTNGVATFGGCSVTTAGTYTLVASSGALTGTSSSFSVAVGPAAQLVFTTGPAGATGGTAFTTQPVVTVEDAGGDTVTGYTGSVTLAIGTNGGGGALSGCTAAVPVSNGTAGFTGCTINRTGSYTLTAVDSTDSPTGTSAAFTVAVGPAASLVFTATPGASTAGVAFATQPAVHVVDAGGNTVTSGDGSAITLDTTPAGFLLGCTTAVTTSSGVATFSGCDITAAGSYSLSATATGIVTGSSGSFNVGAGPKAQLVYTAGPTTATAGIAFVLQPKVTIEDAYGNTETANADTVSLSIAPGTGTVGATLGCTTAQAVAGVATFSGCSINKSGVGYTLTASDGILLTVTGSAFNVYASAPSQLVFSTQPAGATGGTTFTTQPTVAIEDALGNVETTDTSALTATIEPVAGNGTLSSTCAATTTAGVATFTGCSITKVGTYKLQVTDGTDELTALSATFPVTAGPAVSLAVTTQPSGATGGKAFGTQPTVTLLDAGGNVATGSTATVTLAIAADPSGGTLTGCTASTVNGVTTFTGCTIDKAGVGYTLVASSGSLTQATTGPFTVAVGAPARLAFTTQPGPAIAGQVFGLAPAVAVEDAGGNVVTGDTNTVSLAIGTNPDGGTLSGCSAATSAGVTTFTGCVLDTPAVGYTLTATDGPEFLSAISAAFPVLPVTAAPTGYREIARDGGVFSFGTATFEGSTGAIHLNKPIVGSAVTPDGRGYWLVASDGGIFAFGDAAYYGSTGALHLNEPIVGMASTPDGRGYWLVASDGGIFAFGDARFFGSTGALHLNEPIVGIAATPDGQGYWLVASDGGIFAFGDAAFLGSTGALHLNQPIVGMAAHGAGGYWLFAADGGIFSFGDAPFLGSQGGSPLNAPIVGVSTS